VELGVNEEERIAWRNAADAMVVPFDHELGVTSQSEGFTRYRRWDFEAIRPEEYPLLLYFPYYLLYSSQVVKQADLVFALYLCGDRFTPEQKARDFAYYEAVTVRDSSLSASIQAIVAAEIGHLQLAYDYFRETAFADLRDLGANTAAGLHLAALAGTWLVAVAGFGGLRDHGEVLAFSPRLPAPLTRLSFRLRYRGRRLCVEVNPEEARYELLAGESLNVLHHDVPITLRVGEPQKHAYPPLPEPPPASPPPGRAPYARGPSGGR
jgi:alpha,alpha-trehalose phosphorylase